MYTITILSIIFFKFGGSMNKALVILSGGQDSTTCLLMAINKFKKENVYAISFIYNNKYKRDIECAKKICKELGIKHKIFDIGVLQDISKSNNFEGRNLILISLAVIYASANGINNVICGLAGNSSHADCSIEFFENLKTTLKIAIGRNINIEAPLIKLDKSEIWKMADKLGYLKFIENKTFSCWNRQDKHCKECLSCKMRFEGLTKYLKTKNIGGNNE